MFNETKFHDLLQKRINTSDEWYDGLNAVWNELTDLICENINDSIEFLLNKCSEEDFSWLSEFFEQVIEKSLSQEYIDALRVVAAKYPEETSKYNIIEFIDDAQARLDYLLNPED